MEQTTYGRPKWSPKVRFFKIARVRRNIVNRFIYTTGPKQTGVSPH